VLIAVLALLPLSGSYATGLAAEVLIFAIFAKVFRALKLFWITGDAI